MSNPSLPPTEVLALLHQMDGDSFAGVSVTPQLVLQVFGLPHVNAPPLDRLPNHVMKAEFGVLQGTKHYYLVQHDDLLRRRHIRWYLDKVCILTKLGYISKDAYAPLYTAELGSPVD